MSERKLAHIEIIENITPIDGADMIVVAHVLGWECVVKKDEFKVGDKVIYIEVDSIVPDKPEFEFLRERNFRIRTIKLRGQVSQGLVLPLPKKLSSLSVGTDVTKELGIVKYITPSEREEEKQNQREIEKSNKLKKFMLRYSFFRRLFLSKKQKSGFPFWVQKTDEERIQNLHWNAFYEQYKDKKVYITEKIDYQSVTFTGKMIPKYSGLLGKLLPLKKFQFVVCSRNLTTNDKNSLYWKIARQYNIEQILRENPTLTIQGEQGNTNVQGNKYGITKPRLWVFNIIDHEKNYHYDWNEMFDFCEKYGLGVVPVLDNHWDTLTWYGKLSEVGSTVNEWVEFSKGKSIYADIPREGVVVRCIENGKKIFSYKVINPDFLLKFKD